jgi:hypothetical protein
MQSITTLRLDSRDGKSLTPGLESSHFEIALTKRSLLSINDLHITYVSFPYLFEGADPPKIAYLNIRQASEDFVDSEDHGSKRNIVATIDMGAAAYGSMVQYIPNDLESNHQSFHIESRGRDVSSLIVSLIDHDGNILDLHGHPMQIIMRCANKGQYERFYNPNKRKRLY